MRRVWWGGAWVTMAAVIAVVVGTGAVKDVNEQTTWKCAYEDGCFPKPPGSGKGSVGIPPGTTLHVCGTDETTTIVNANTVIDGCEYTGSLLIAANNVTIRNSRIQNIRSQGQDAGFHFTVEDSEIGPPIEGECGTLEALIGIQNYTAYRNYLHSNGDGFRVAGDDVIVQDNYVDLCSNPLDHSDGIQGFGGGLNVRVEHNTFDQRPAESVTAPVFFADNSSSAIVKNNLLLAVRPDAYALRIHDDHTPDIGPWRITGNRVIGRSLTTELECGAATTTWADNRQVTVSAGYKLISVGGLVAC